jgi:hypothetical protein
MTHLVERPLAHDAAHQAEIVRLTQSTAALLMIYPIPAADQGVDVFSGWEQATPAEGLALPMLADI